MSSLNPQVSYQKLKYLITGNIEYGIVGKVNNRTGIRYVRISDISSNCLLKNVNQQYFENSENIPNNKFIKTNDILLACAGETIGKSYLHNEIYKDQLMTYASFLVRVRTEVTKLIPKFFYYYTLSSEFEDWKNIVNVQSTIQNLSAFKYANLPVPVFNISHQQKIVDFLDWKVNEIDKLLSITLKKYNNLLDLKRKVHEDTLLSFKKDLPKNKVHEIKIKYFAKLYGRIGWQGLTSSEYSSNEGILLITGNNFYNENVDFSTCVRVPKFRWEQNSNIQIKNNDLLITKDGTVGKLALVSGLNEIATLNSGIMKIEFLRDDIVTKEFLLQILKSNVFKKWFHDINPGFATIIHLYQKDFYQFKFQFPSIEIQNEITKKIKEFDSYFNKLIDVTSQKINKLKELKQTLITEVVTGKRNVQDIVIPEYEKFDYTVNLSEDDIDTEDLDSLEDLDNLEQLED